MTQSTPFKSHFHHSVLSAGWQPVAISLRCHVSIKDQTTNPVVFCVDGGGNERIVFPTVAATIIPPGDNLSVSTLKE